MDMLLGTVTDDPITGEPMVDLGDDVHFAIQYTRTGWIVFTPMNEVTREACAELVELGFIRAHGYGYVSTAQQVFEPWIEKTRNPRASH